MARRIVRGDAAVLTTHRRSHLAAGFAADNVAVVSEQVENRLVLPTRLEQPEGLKLCKLLGDGWNPALIGFRCTEALAKGRYFSFADSAFYGIAQPIANHRRLEELLQQMRQLSELALLGDRLSCQKGRYMPNCSQDGMRIIKEPTLAAYAKKYARAAVSLQQWRIVARETNWRSLAEVRATYANADAIKVGSGRVVTVFNIAGNRFRLVTAIHYNRGLIFILRFLTHAEYDQGNWKREL